MQNDLAVRSFAGDPWRTIRHKDWPSARGVPTMLGREEQQFYLWATRDWARGRGHVVDLGAFVGGSTAWLAEGYRAGGHRGDIHAYDKFTADAQVKQTLLLDQGVEPFEGSDTYELAQKNLAPWGDQIKMHRGCIERRGWTGDPIEILAVDSFKKVALIDKMVSDFFPFLVPGHALIIQQDLLHWRTPWIVVLMWRLRDVVRPVAYVPRDTVSFLVERPITQTQLQAAKVGALSDDEIVSDILASRDWFESWDLCARLDYLAATMAANPGCRVSWQMRRPPQP